MRMDGATKVTIFKEKITFGDDKEEMLALADLFGEAANWLRGEVVRQVNLHTKKKEYHRIYNITVSTVFEDCSSVAEEGPSVKLYIHYDDNVKG
jgi:hypothetical protein